MTATFASQPWIDQLAESLQGSATARTESVTWVHGPLLLVVDADAELGLDTFGVRIDLHEGTIRSVDRVTDVDERRVPFVIAGPLQRWKQVFTGAGSLGTHLIESRFRTRGDLPTLARHRVLLDAISSAGGSIETTWQDDKEPAAAQA